MRRVWLALAGGLALSSGLLAAEGGVSPREAFSQPLPGISAEGAETYQRGRVEFLQSWAFPPEGGTVSGLGPLFNRLSCVSCHQRNGRGHSPNAPDERMLSMLVRLSVPGHDEHGGPKAHPTYGTQLNEEGAPGLAGEGREIIHWQDVPFGFADGTHVALRKPVLGFTDLAYGPIAGTLASPRVGQPVYGLGLLEAVPEATLRQLAKDEQVHGAGGRLNSVWDVASGKMAIGRFGWKANSPTLRQQIAEAFLGDMGVTSSLFTQAQCAERQEACRKLAVLTTTPELSGHRLDDITYFIAHVAPPPRRNIDQPAVRSGEGLFAAIGCAACHAPSLRTADHPLHPDLTARDIAPYSDLLLHDMGEGLADNRPDFAASGREWRTTPLWGIGLVPQVNGHSQYLHDGRARNLEEAVLWHGGQAQAARDHYAALPKAGRDQLLAFLGSL